MTYQQLAFRDIWSDGTEALTAGQIFSSLMEVPVELQPLVAPRRIQAADYRWPIFDFFGGTAERAKDEAVADFQAVFNKAVRSGEKVHLPAWRYPLRTAGDENDGTHPSAVFINSDTPIDMEGVYGKSVLIPDPSFFGVNASLFDMRAASSPTVTGTLMPFRWSNITVDGSDMTDAHGQGSGPGYCPLALYRYHHPVVENCIFDAGLTDFVLGAGYGNGALDTAIHSHGTTGDVIRGNVFRGFYDLAYYPSGDRISVEVGPDPITTSVGTPTVTITCTALTRPSVGQIVGIGGATAVGGLTLLGQYVVQTTPSSTTFTITAGGNASSTATGGGSAVLINNSTLSDSYATDMTGQDFRFCDNRVIRCASAVSAKRNWLGYVISGNYIRDGGNGILASDVTEPSFDGKIAHIFGNDLYKLQNFPLRVIGAGARIHHNRIQNWGRLLVDDGLTRTDLGLRMPAIDIRAARGTLCDHNQILQEIGTNWVTQDAPNSEATIGIIIQTDSGYSNSIAQYKMEDASIDHNVIDYAQYGIREETGADNNYIGKNRVTNWTAFDLFKSGINTLIDEILPVFQDVTISGGAITVIRPFNAVDTEGAAATDDLTDILGMPVGSEITLKGKNSSHDVTVKHNAGGSLGNILCGSDFTFTNANDLMRLLRISTATWLCLFRSDNL